MTGSVIEGKKSTLYKMKEKHVADISNVCNRESYCWRCSLNAAIVVASERRRCVLI